MGLDMNLSRRSYVKNWNHTKPEALHQISITQGGKPTKIKPERISYIIEDIAYWRKANAIHRWFVNTVQKGEDDCGDYDVSTEQLKELLSLCDRVAADHSLAESLLPPQEGFFFGSTEIDEYYFEDIENTRKMLTEILAEVGEDYADFSYHSSW